MRQFLVLAAIFGLSSCGRLDSQYLPPNQGGNFNQAQGSFNQQAQGSFNQQPQGSFNHQSQSSFNHQAQGSFNQASFNKGPDGPINKAANDVPILKLDNENDGETYNYALETGDGISVQEHGDARGDGTNAEGGFSYTAPDGQQIQIQYTAGENGFIPQGAHIPTAPPVPADILKAIEQNLADEANGVFDDGQYKEEHSNYGAKAHAGQQQQHGGQQSGGYGSQSQNSFNFQAQKQYVPPAPSNQGKNGYQY